MFLARMPGDLQRFESRTRRVTGLNCRGELLNVSLLLPFTSRRSSLPGDPPLFFITETFLLRSLQSPGFDQEALTLVSSSGAAESYNYSAKHRVLPAPAGQGSISAGQKNEMVQVRAFQAQWPLLFHLQQVSLPQLHAALRAFGVAQDGKYNDVLTTFRGLDFTSFQG
jgi:hypothetical protein